MCLNFKTGRLQKQRVTVFVVIPKLFLTKHTARHFSSRTQFFAPYLYTITGRKNHGLSSKMFSAGKFRNFIFCQFFPQANNFLSNTRRQHFNIKACLDHSVPFGLIWRNLFGSVQWEVTQFHCNIWKALLLPECEIENFQLFCQHTVSLYHLEGVTASRARNTKFSPFLSAHSLTVTSGSRCCFQRGTFKNFMFLSDFLK